MTTFHRRDWRVLASAGVAMAAGAFNASAQTPISDAVAAFIALDAIADESLGQVGALSAMQRRPEDANPLYWHTADPAAAADYIQKELQKEQGRSDRKFGESLLERLQACRRPNQISLSLQSALHRAVANNFAVRVESYNPGINTARIVEAEAAFDAVFFANMTKNIVDRPSASQLGATKVDVFNLTQGVRKRLATGAEVTASLQLQRQFINLVFQQLNPEYTSNLAFEIRQPLLRGAGIDFNRAQIEIALNNLRISKYQFKRSLRQLVFNVEQAYWRLTQARREVSIRARLLTEFEQTYDYLEERSDFDVYPIQLSQTKAEIESSKADFIGTLNNLQQAEDNLIALMNDSEINLADDFEIIPSDFPSDESLEIDRLAEVRAALDNRSEIHETRVAIDNAGISIGQAKNLALPVVDLTLRTQIHGLGESMDDAFDQVTQNRFHEYFIQLDVSVPFGNRAARAILRRAQLSHAAAIANVKRQTEEVILEVNTAARDIGAEYDRIDPFLRSAEANEDQVAAVIARAERKDFPALNQELNARRALANARSQLLDALTRYNIALAELERSKGTILDYNNIIITDPHDADRAEDIHQSNVDFAPTASEATEIEPSGDPVDPPPDHD